jgi:hypothetical protein
MTPKLLFFNSLKPEINLNNISYFRSLRCALIWHGHPITAHNSESKSQFVYLLKPEIHLKKMSVSQKHKDWLDGKVTCTSVLINSILRSTEEKTRRDRIKNLIFREVLIQHLWRYLKGNDYNGWSCKQNWYRTRTLRKEFELRCKGKRYGTTPKKMVQPSREGSRADSKSKKWSTDCRGYWPLWLYLLSGIL